MDKNYEDAKRLLQISSVNLQNSLVDLEDDIISSEFSIDNLDKQVFRNVSSVRELEAVNEDNQWIEYHFIYSVGMRFISKIEDIEDENTGEVVADNPETEEPEIKQFLEIKAKFKAIYFSQEKLDKDCIIAFCKENVGYHVWPYWREFVQHNCGRLGIDNIVIETYKVKTPPNKTEEQ